MSEQEMLVLSTKERDRLKVLHEVEKKHLTQRGAAAQLGISNRWVRKLLLRLKGEGDRGVVHRLRGRPSKRRLAESLRTKALELVKSKYRDFGPTLACEYLAKKDGVKVSKETLRQWLVAAGLRRAKRQKAEEVHVWRPRRSCRGGCSGTPRSTTGWAGTEVVSGGDDRRCHQPGV
jgi:transposase